MTRSLLDELAAQAGGSVAEGAFTLDRDKAKEKLRHFQLADPCAWLLELVRAAVVLGARELAVETDADDVRVRFDGAPFSREDVDEIYAALLAKNAPAARAHLAVALNAVMALEPRFVRVESVDERGAGVRLEVRPDTPDAIDVIEPPKKRKAGAHTGTTVHVREQFRAGHFVAFFRAMAGTKREIQALRRACRFSALRITINGKPIQSTPIGVSASAGGQAAGALVLLHRGVVLEEVAHPLLPIGARVVLEGEGLSRDASLQAFRRDAALAALLDGAFVEVLEAAEASHALGRARAAQSFGEAVLALARGDAPATLGDAAAWPKLSAALRVADRPCRTAPLFADVRGGVVSLNELCAEQARHGRIFYARRETSAAALPRTFVLVRDDEESARLFAVAGAMAEDGEPALRAAEVHAQNAAKLAQRRARTALPPDDYIARVALEGGAYRGELALRRYGASALVVSFFTDGCLVGTEPFPCPLPGLSLAIEGRFTLTSSFDGVVRDRALIDALSLAWARVPALLAQVPPDVTSDALERVRAIGAPFLLWTLGADAMRRLFLNELERTVRLTEPLPADDALPPLPPVVFVGADAHPLARVPLLKRADGALCSIDELRRQRVITVIPHEISTFSQPDAIPAGKMLRKVLEQLAPLDVQDDRAQREQHRARLLLQPRTAVRALDRVFAEGEHAGMKVRLSLGDEPRTVLFAAIDGRPWTSLSLSSRVGPLRIDVDDEAALPDLTGNIEPAHIERMTRAAMTVMPRFAEQVAQEARTKPRARDLAFSMTRALFPTAPLRAAAEALDTASYLALLRFAEELESSVFNSLVELALEVEKRPVPDVLRALATELQLSPSAAHTTDVSDLRFAVALFGGEQALVTADAGQVVRAMFARLPGLGELALRTLSDRVVTLGELVERARSGPIAYVPLAFGAADGFDHVILDDERREALGALLGAGQLVDRSQEVRAALARRAFEERPKDTTRLSPSAHVVVHDFADGAVTGQVGLVAPRATEPYGSLRVLSDGRFVTRLDVSQQTPLSLAAVIDDPDLALTTSMDGIASPGAQARLISVVARAADAALDALLDEAEADREALARRAPDAEAVLLERVATQGSFKPSPARLQRLATVPLVRDARGGWLSLTALRAAAKKGAAGFLSAMPREPIDNEGMTIALVENAVARDLLRRVVGAPLKDALAEWSKATALRAKREALPPLPTAPADAVVRADDGDEAVGVSLWLQVGAVRPTVHLGGDGKTVRVVDVDAPLRSLCGAVDAAAWVDASWSDVDQSKLRSTLDPVAIELARKLCNAALAGDVIAEIEARALVTTLALRFSKLRKKWRALFEELQHVALFPVADGARVSLFDALGTRPPSLVPFLVATGLIPAAEVAEAPPPSAQAVAKDASAATTEETAEETAARAAERRRAALRARLEETLSLVKLEDHAAAELLRWPLAVEARGGGVCAELSNGRTRVDVDHPLARRALDVTDDPAPFFLLCAVVYGAINAHLQEVTPAHERAFLARLLTHAASAR